MQPATNSDKTELWPRLPGIVGGLGPFAHIELERRLLEAAAQRWKSLGQPLTDQRYLPWVVASIPQTPDRTAALQNREPSPLPGLLAALGVLERCNCDFALIACNTAHAWIREIREASRLPILDIVQATTQEIRTVCGPHATIGLLATDGTLASGVYATRAAAVDRGPCFLSPLDVKGGQELQRIVMHCIYGRVDSEFDTLHGGVKSGVHLRDVSVREEIEEQLCRVLERLVGHGVAAVVLGCTELPLILSRDVIRRRLGRDISLVDPMDVAARTAVRISAGEEPLPENKIQRTAQSSRSVKLKARKSGPT